MAAKSDAFAHDMLALIFNGAAISGLADNAASGALADLYLALHTADPSASGTQQSSETNYVGYARQAVARTSAGFVVSSPPSPKVTLNSQVNFPDPAAGTSAQTITHWSVGVAGSGATEILYRGPVSPVVPISVGLAGPALATGTTITEV